MGTIKYANQTTPDTPASGYTEVYVDTADKHLKQRDDTGTVIDITASDTAIQESLIDAAGDIIVGTADNTAGRLAPPSLSAGDGDMHLMVIDDDATPAPTWVKHQGNTADLNYQSAATYDIDYATDHIIVGVASENMTYSFTEPNDYFAATGRGKLFSFKNATTDYILTVKLDGASTFQNGLNEVKVYPRDVLNMGVVRANVADGYFLMQTLNSNLQTRYSTTWDASNWSTVTAIPFDTNDHVHDANIIDHSTSSNQSRILLGPKGEYFITFWAAIDSTGGASYNASGYLRADGTTTIAGSSWSVGNYQTEDSHVCIGPIRYEATSVDTYIEVMADNNTLTGNMNNMVCAVEAII